MHHLPRSIRRLSSCAALALLGCVATAAAAQQAAPRRETVVYFISSSSCVANQQPGFKQDVGRMLTLLRARRPDPANAVSVVGVSIDPTAPQGIEYLRQLGEFDEVVAGRNWMNSAVVDFVWRRGFAEAAIPQVVVVERSVQETPSGIVVGQDTPVAKFVGSDVLHAWIARGAPLGRQ